MRLANPARSQSTAQELAGMHSNGYKCVAKEVQAGAGDVEQVKKEVELHNLCSQGCNDIVRCVFSGFATAAPHQLIVVMEACHCDLWTVLTAALDGGASKSLDRAPSNVSVSSRDSKPGLKRAASGSCVWTPQGGKLIKQPSIDERAEWTQSLCRALQHCHKRRVLHRDVNPWNVLVTYKRDGERCREVRLADFGLAALVPAGAELSGIEADGAVPLDESAMNSLYSAPELGKSYGMPSDVFSMGMTLLALWAAADVGAGVAAKASDDLITYVESAKEAALQGEALEQSLVSHLKAGSVSAPPADTLLLMVSAAAHLRPTADEVVFATRSWYGKHTAPMLDEKGADEADEQTKPKRCCVCPFSRKGRGMP
mmetsp:Transcript_3562/g.5046  ORF Transcript_3562/g.5046 Transcript_3562/m.5046 type:complete len:370 (-) Transcript_3562:1-1110(-)